MRNKYTNTELEVETPLWFGEGEGYTLKFLCKSEAQKQKELDCKKP